MTTQIFNISNNKEAINGKWYRKESIKIGDIVIVKQIVGDNEVELGEKDREELFALLEMGGKFAYRDIDFGEWSGIAEMCGWSEPEWNYIYSAQLF